MDLHVNGKSRQVRVESRETKPDGSIAFRAVVDETILEGSWIPGHLLIEGRSIPYTVSRNSHGSASILTLWCQLHQIQWPDQLSLTERVGVSSGTAASNQIAAPLNGQIVKIAVQEGSIVSQGDVLLVLEAMKMENEISAPSTGMIRNIFVSAGQVVTSGQLLMEIQGD